MTKPLHKQWTNTVSNNNLGLLIEQSATDLQKARLQGVNCRGARDWLNALPSNPFGLCLQDDQFRITCGIRFLYSKNKDVYVAPLSSLTACMPWSAPESPQGARDTPYAMKLSVTPFKPLKFPSHLNLLAFSVMTDADRTASPGNVAT